MSLPELLAPAGSYEVLISAVNSGADAVYLSGKKFGARAFAQNFSLKEIKESVNYA
ncbi:MAG: U32 family peptidase, partial [Methanobacteriaceae archaeon]|nr:U32 family peptidase [Methanobacteriaceae archaeon]